MASAPSAERGADMIARFDASRLEALRRLLEPWGLAVSTVPADAEIPGSFWDESEAGLSGATLWLRADTPVHSALHEAAHYVCMDAARRRHLHRDAGGDFEEENAVCYLQILWGAALPGIGSARVMADMDAWGYTFRLGSARAWFDGEAESARAWLQTRGIVDADGLPRVSSRIDPSL